MSVTFQAIISMTLWVSDHADFVKNTIQYKPYIEYLCISLYWLQFCGQYKFVEYEQRLYDIVLGH